MAGQTRSGLDSLRKSLGHDFITADVHGSIWSIYQADSPGVTRVWWFEKKVSFSRPKISPPSLCVLWHLVKFLEFFLNSLWARNAGESVNLRHGGGTSAIPFIRKMNYLQKGVTKT
jgi:hypothetical protein